MGSCRLGRWVGVGLLVTGSLWAQQPPEEALLRDCFALREQGRFDAAFDRCTRAVTVSRSGRSLAQLAITEFALRRWTATATHIAEALADRTNPLPDRSRAVLLETMTQVRPHVAELRVEANEGDATVLINGQAVGTLPLATPLYLDAGVVMLTVHPRAGAAVTRSVTLTAGQTSTESVRIEHPVAVAVPEVPVRPAPVGPSAPSAPGVSVGSTQRVLAWTTAGLALAGFGLSLAAWRLREGATSDYVAECPTGDVGDAAVVARCMGLHTQADHDVNQWGTVATVGVIAGAVMAVTSVVLFATAPSRRSEARAVRCGGGPGVVGIGCAVAF